MKPASRHFLVPSSLLDRLLDDNTRLPSEAQVDSHYDMSGYKQSVARDLEALLNTRSVLDDTGILDNFPLAKKSLLSFGITDLSSLSFLNPDDRMFLQESIRISIERHEARLSQVKVSLDVAKDPTRTLRFRVDAVLKVHPSHPPVSFDALLHLSSNTYLVKG